MTSVISDYFKTLSERFGAGWNRFWYTPSDPATLALLRIGTGLMALYFVSSYSFDIVRLFGPQGMLPIETVTELRGDERGGFSYLNYFRLAPELYAVHAVGLAILVLFTLGLFTRITSVLALIVVLSYIHRGPVLTGIFEPILTMVMFYLCLGPCGAALSLDAWRAKKQTGDDISPPTFGATVSQRLVQVHLSVVYFMMAIGKIAELNDTWWLGEAVWWLMARPESRVIDLTGVLYNHPYLINAWTHGIVLFELTFAVLIWNRLARPLLLGIAVPMWIALALITGHTAFCMMMLVANLAFVEPAVMRAALARITGREAAPQAA